MTQAETCRWRGCDDPATGTRRFRLPERIGNTVFAEEARDQEADLCDHHQAVFDTGLLPTYMIQVGPDVPEGAERGSGWLSGPGKGR